MKIKMVDSISDGPAWFYANKHGLHREQFLAAAKEKISRECGIFEEEMPTLEDIREVWFQRMSPSEARSQGVDSGVWLVNTAQHGAYPVTLVEA